MLPSLSAVASGALLVALCSVTTALDAQRSPRELRIEVKDRAGAPVPTAHVSFFLTSDTVTTDSAGVATITVDADSAINISVRKIGYEQRNARFRIGTAPAFSVKIVLGEAGQSLPEVVVRDEYPGEPWRRGYEQRKKRGGGLFRDVTAFAGGQPSMLGSWFEGLPNVRTGGGPNGDINISRCKNLGVWIDGQHATSPFSPYRYALQSVPAQDIAAIEIYTSNTPAQYTGYSEDCSLLIWTRHR